MKNIMTIIGLLSVCSFSAYAAGYHCEGPVLSGCWTAPVYICAQSSYRGCVVVSDNEPVANSRANTRVKVIVEANPAACSDKRTDKCSDYCTTILAQEDTFISAKDWSGLNSFHDSKFVPYCEN